MVVQAQGLGGSAGPEAVGFVVAGGRSLRMGRDKALLAWDGSTLLDHAVARLHAVCADVLILSGAGRRYTDRGLPVQTDAIPDAGPLGGIYTGLVALGPGTGLFLGVDLPFASVDLLRRLLDLSVGHDAVVPLSAAGPEPLCAVYRSTCLDPIRRRLAARELKATSFWPDVDVLLAGPDHLEGLGPIDDLFRNVNTPADYERARAGSRR